MPKILFLGLLISLCLLSLALCRLLPTAAPQDTNVTKVSSKGEWVIEFDNASGALVRIANKNDRHAMNWLREPGRWERNTWVQNSSSEAKTHGGQWGLIETTQTGLLHVAQTRQISENTWESVYYSSFLTVTVRRELTDDALIEAYTFQNTGTLSLDFPLGSVAINAPLFDQYPDAARSLTARCHVHLWMGGNSAWINATRMAADPPHLGLVVTKGSLDAYSQRGGTINDRGTFLLHPAAMKIAPGQMHTIAWRLFWHKGWDDFFTKARAQENFIQLSAERYTVVVGEPIEIVALSNSSLKNVILTANGKSIPTRFDGSTLRATLPTTRLGEIKLELNRGNTRTWLYANVVPSSDALIDARVRFIVRHQQHLASGDPLDGAYLSFDNETDQQVYATEPSDHNAGRERVGMGVLAALYLPLCQDEAFRKELITSLRRYTAFVSRELEDETGVIYGTIGRKDAERLYNYPWVAHFHLALYQATHDKEQLDRAVRVLKTYYARGGKKFYAIGLPVTDTLKVLAEAGHTTERTELLALFRAHADNFLQIGTNYPQSEVNYEQSIVAPSVQLLLEVYFATGETKYLEGAKLQLRLLEAFCGRQPDHRLNEVSIRHWDDYWFGKLKLYGDTFPHYWSVLNAPVYSLFGHATSDKSYIARATAVTSANLSLFTPDGRASAAHLYPLTSNGRSAAVSDPWANDQDWVLVNLLMTRDATWR